jgi:DNA polymerase III delta subunit
LRAKKPDAAFEVIRAEDWNPDLIEHHLGGQGLFSNKYIVFLDHLSLNEEAAEKLADFIPSMNESPNIFIALEGKLSADLKKAYEKSAEKVVEFELKSEAGGFKSGTGMAGSKKDFNIFALGDALGSRDSLKAWNVYRQAVENGQESESILGTLFWQVKSMIQAYGAKSAGEAGLNPFVYSKSKKFSSNYSSPELKNLLEDLIILYHDGHRGMVDMELGIERMLLCVAKIEDRLNE